MNMKSIKRVLLASFLYLCGWSANAQHQIGNGRISGDFGFDGMYYIPDSIIGAEPVDSKVRGNAFLNILYSNGGFSAGAHLATLWGTKHLGASSFYEPQPKMLMLAYPLFSLLSPSEPIKQLLIRGLFGENGTQEDAKRYCAAYSMDEEYPPVYIVRAEDDQTVTVQDTQLLLWALDNAGVEYRYEKAPSGGHGFGLGTETPFFGWLERAVEYYEIIRNNR